MLVFSVNLFGLFCSDSNVGTCMAHWNWALWDIVPGCVVYSDQCKNGRRPVDWYAAFNGCQCECLCNNGYSVWC